MESIQRKGNAYQCGMTLLEAAIILPILILLTFGLIDIGRYLYYQSLVKDSLNEAVRLAQVQIGDIAELDRPAVAAANAPSLAVPLDLSHRRASVVNSIFQKMLAPSKLSFEKFTHIDQISDSTHRIEEALPFALLPAGTGGWFSKADGSVSIVTNSHVCPDDSWQNGHFDSGSGNTGPSDDGLLEVYGKLKGYSCPVAGGLKLERSHGRGLGYYSRLFPFEVVARYTMQGIVLGRFESEVKAAGYFPYGLAATHPDPHSTATATPEGQPSLPPEASPTPVPTSTGTFTPAPTPTEVPTERPTETPTPSPTSGEKECVLTKVKISQETPYDDGFVNSGNNVIAGSGYANLQCLNRFLDLCKSDNQRTRVEDVLVSTWYYHYRTKESLYYQNGKPVPESHYEKIGEDLFRFADGTILKMPSLIERDPYFKDPVKTNNESDDCVMYEILRAFGYDLDKTGVTDQQILEFEGYFKGDCSPVKSSDVGTMEKCQESVWVSIWGSPISLLWNGSDELKQQSVVCNFPLLPDSEGQCFTWKASEEAPLLVFDPSHTGVVKAREQLFGNWTFGGKDAPARNLPNQPWRDGFEALKTLDKDKNGEISGDELAPLALWFDQNRNGVSEPGEVRAATAAGLSRLVTDSSETIHRDNAIYLKDGFSRIINGKEVKGTSVDWYGEKAESSIESLGKELLRSRKSGEAIVLSRDREADSKETTGPLNGIWRWEALDIAKDGASESARVGGVLTFSERNGKVSGHTLIEPEFSGGSYRSGLVISPLTGELTQDSSGVVSLRFEVLDRKGNRIRSMAQLSRDGAALIGESSAQIVRSDGLRSDFNYRWKAVPY